jgi:hypothetical protein
MVGKVQSVRSLEESTVLIFGQLLRGTLQRNKEVTLEERRIDVRVAAQAVGKPNGRTDM